MKMLISAALAVMLALSGGLTHAAGEADASKPNSKHLKKLNACNKKAAGKRDEAYREAMKECMAKAG